MPILTTIGALVAILAGIATIIGLKYGYDQITLMRKQIELMQLETKERKQKEAEDDEWALRFETLQRILLRINPTLQVREPGNTNTTYIYSTMFDSKLRARIESFIIKVDTGQTHFLPREVQPHQLRSATMRETIEKAEAEMQAFIEKHPFCKQHLMG